VVFQEILQGFGLKTGRTNVQIRYENRPQTLAVWGRFFVVVVVCCRGQHLSKWVWHLKVLLCHWAFESAKRNELACWRCHWAPDAKCFL
jgi:hypothetical protein